MFIYGYKSPTYFDTKEEDDEYYAYITLQNTNSKPTNYEYSSPIRILDTLV